MKKLLTSAIALMLLLSLIIAPVSAKEVAQGSGPGRLPARTDLVPTGFDGTVEKFTAVEPDFVIEGSKEGNYFIFFEGDSLVVNSGGSRSINVESGASEAYLAQMEVNRNQVITTAEKTLGRQLEIEYVYDVILNAVSVTMSREEAMAVQNVPGVKKVLLSTTQTLDTDAGPRWIGADGVWSGSAVPDSVGNKGEGILAGIIDSGINFDHPSFSDTPADGFVYEWTGDYLGVCAPAGTPAYAAACNDKVVGAYTYTLDTAADFVTPEDSNGHGSHTASTVAGNELEVDFNGEMLTISGVAPHAQIIVYDACYPTPTGGSCQGNDLVASVQQAVIDGVDVINYSISGGEDPYNDAVELAFLEAFGAGVVVSTSAGNSGPDAATVAHRSPWVLTTAASTHNRKFTNQVNFSNPLYQGIATLAGLIPFSVEILDSPVVYAGEDTGNDLGCDAFPADFFTGSIALIKRGTCNFSIKVNNAATAGATGVFVFTDNRAPGAMSAPGTTIPNVMLDISGVLGQEIAYWVAAQTNETVDVTPVGYYVSDAYGDIMAEFSSRGPNNTFDLLKPDVSAPGMEILAAVADGTIAPSEEYELDQYQGTSMSSPHDAGAAALLSAEHPTWTPAMVKSALMLTAYDGMLKEDKLTPADLFDTGAGRLNLKEAALVGLVMDETYANMLAADPATGGDVATLNIASLYDSTCVGGCSWSRTFTSVAPITATYTAVAPSWLTVTPPTFEIAPGATQVITFTADVLALPSKWQFENVYFNTDAILESPYTYLFLPLVMNGSGTPAAGTAPVASFIIPDRPLPDVAIPVAVFPASSNLPAWVSFETHRNADSGTIKDLVAVEITDLTVDTYGFVKGIPTTFELAEDSTTNPFDNLAEVNYSLIDMTAGAARLVAEITETTSPDLDLFWGFDLNGDGLPAANEVYESSANAGSFEYLSDWGFPVPFYDVWVLVQNYTGSAAATDTVTLMLGNVPWAAVDPATMTVTGPETNPAEVPFELNVLWHGIETEPGDRLYGLFDAYADAAYVVGLGLTEVDVVRGEDDVVKTADVQTAKAGDVITYTIEITNPYDVAMPYTLNDPLPKGVRYVDGSATGGATYDANSNAILWSGIIDAPGVPYYKVTDSTNDELCIDGYINLSDYSIFPGSSRFGDSQAWGFGAGSIPFNFYGVEYAALYVTDDGYAIFDPVNTWLPAEDWWTNQDIPDPTLPNALAAVLWQDMEVVYDATLNKGVTVATMGPNYHVFEYDDVQLYGVPGSTYDFEIVYQHAVDDTPGAYEIYFAYDNINGPLNATTIGLENYAGTEAATYAYNNASFNNGHMVCFDYTIPSTTQMITFQVTVDADAAAGVLINEALHDNDHLGTVEESAEVTVAIEGIPVMEPKINEFVADHVGTDTVEFVEIFGSPSTDYATYTILEIEGDSGVGVIDKAVSVGTTDAKGLFLVNIAGLENGTVSLLLVRDFTGATGQDIDTNDDGIIDYEPWSEIVDSVAVLDGGSTEKAYGLCVLIVGYDGLALEPGGASRIPDGYDTDSPSDWVRNDWDLAGIPGFVGTPIVGEAYNTPGALNAVVK